MVEELITCHADVNAVDELGTFGCFAPMQTVRVTVSNASLTGWLPSLLGKSALHWAAAVNNVDATIALLKNGANKDMQDLKV